MSRNRCSTCHYVFTGSHRACPFCGKKTAVLQEVVVRLPGKMNLTEVIDQKSGASLVESAQ